MATLEYIDIPVGATRISDTINGKKGQVNNDIRPTTKIMTGLLTKPISIAYIIQAKRMIVVVD